MIQIERITKARFRENSLDDYIRTQTVTEVYMQIDGVYQLVERPFTDDWTPERKREKAREILSDAYITYGAYDGDRVVGFVMLDKKLHTGRLIVDSFQVSQDHRRHGIGRALFAKAVEEGRRLGAKALYVSACCSKETIAFYRAMGCVLTQNVIPSLAEDEPWDLQLERSL